MKRFNVAGVLLVGACTVCSATVGAEERAPTPASAVTPSAPSTEPTQRVKRPGYVVGGSITMGIGAVATAAGLGLIFGDDGATLGVAPAYGYLLTAFGVVHFAIGIPLVAVGAQPYRKNVADLPGLDTLEIELSGSHAGLKLTF